MLQPHAYDKKKKNQYCTVRVCDGVLFMVFFLSVSALSEPESSEKSWGKKKFSEVMLCDPGCLTAITGKKKKKNPVPF